VTIEHVTKFGDDWPRNLRD